MKCPKCKSENLTSNKKGFSGKKAVAGAVLVGGIGVLAGTIGSGKVKITCLDCGYQYIAGEYQKEVSKIQEKNRQKAIIKAKTKSVTDTEVIFINSILASVFIIISWRLLVNDWIFFGIISSIVTLILVGIVILFAMGKKQERKSSKTYEKSYLSAREISNFNERIDILNDLFSKAQRLEKENQISEALIAYNEAFDYGKKQSDFDYKNYGRCIDSLISLYILTNQPVKELEVLEFALSLKMHESNKVKYNQRLVAVKRIIENKGM